jgi:hypothetical protein
MAEKPRVTRWSVAGAAGLGAALLALVVPLAAGRARPGYDAAAQFISELGERGSPHGPLVSLAGFFPIGLLGLAFVAFGAGALGPLRRARAGALCFAAVPLAYVVAAFAPCDPGCPAVGGPTQALHNAFGGLEYAGGATALLLLASAFAATPAWRAWAWPTAVAALVVLASFGALLGGLGPRGALQRAAEAALFLWIAAVSVRLLRGVAAVPG